ncbi:MAG: YdeI/OmpD-associated family protein [Candidatus Eisenbacteria bacterium]|nr:YdeI/OmpD-associated family protein [Candidatus Eisenbacteria bacterium]
MKENHHRSKCIWLIFYKIHSGKALIPYEDAVEEALCFGWIDSIIKKIDADRYARKFTPRKDGSKWSELNKKRARKLIKQKRMLKAGMDKIKIAKENGEWNRPSLSGRPPEVPAAFKAALAKNRKAKEFYARLAPSYQKQFIGWIASAKKGVTRDRRIKEAVYSLERGQKLGMK